MTEQNKDKTNRYYVESDYLVASCDESWLNIEETLITLRFPTNDHKHRDHYYLLSSDLTLWDNGLMLTFIKSMEAYMNYLGDGVLEEFLSNTYEGAFEGIELVIAAVERKTPLIDLWCLFASLSALNYRDVPYELLESVVRSRKPLVTYDKSILSTSSAKYYLSPYFPYTAILSPRYVTNNKYRVELEMMKRNAQSMMLLTGKVGTLAEAVENIDLTVVCDRELTEDESKAVGFYASLGGYEQIVNSGLDVSVFSCKQFVNMFARMVSISDKNCRQLNEWHFKRVLDGFDFVEMGNEKYDKPDLYWHLTPYEAEIYDDMFASYEETRKIEITLLTDDYFYLHFLKNPERFREYSRSYPFVMNGLKQTLESNVSSDSSTFKSLNFLNLGNFIHRDYFGLREIFEEFMSGSDLPFEILVSIKLDLDKNPEGADSLDSVLCL